MKIRSASDDLLVEFSALQDNVAHLREHPRAVSARAQMSALLQEEMAERGGHFRNGVHHIPNSTGAPTDGVIHHIDH